MFFRQKKSGNRVYLQIVESGVSTSLYHPLYLVVADTLGFLPLMPAAMA